MVKPGGGLDHWDSNASCGGNRGRRAGLLLTGPVNHTGTVEIKGVCRVHVYWLS